VHNYLLCNTKGKAKALFIKSIMLNTKKYRDILLNYNVNLMPYKNTSYVYNILNNILNGNEQKINEASTNDNNSVLD
jgi:hypothetical protein